MTAIGPISASLPAAPAAGACSCAAPAGPSAAPAVPAAPTALPQAAPPTVLGTQLLGSAAPATPAAPATAAPVDPLRGFVTPGTAAARAQLGTALGSIDGTTVGSALLTAIRDKGVTIDILDDAQFNARAPGSKDAAGVTSDRFGPAPTVLLRASSLVGDNGDKLRHVLAHELTHAAQFVAGEQQQTYAAGIGAAANGLTADQLNVGRTLMQEAGSEYVAGAIEAQLQQPAIFAANARSVTDAAAASSWQRVNISGYNPRAYALPQLVSPTAQRLVKQALG